MSAVAEEHAVFPAASGNGAGGGGAAAAAAAGGNGGGSPSSGSDGAGIAGVAPGGGASGANNGGSQPETKGWLYKWTNYIKGYQKRWFVLANGLLHYYRNQAEMARACRGSISLHGAHIYTEDSCNFIVSNAGGTQTYHLRAASEVERQHWVTALEMAKAKAIKRVSSMEPDSLLENEDDEDIDKIDKQELTNVVNFLTSKLEDMKTCHSLIEKQKLSLQHNLSELELSNSAAAAANSGGGVTDMKVKAVNERAALLCVTCSAMIKASAEFLDFCQLSGRRWYRILERERDIRLHLEDMVQQLAKQQFNLEAMVKQHNHNEKLMMMSPPPQQAAAGCFPAADGATGTEPESTGGEGNSRDAVIAASGVPAAAAAASSGSNSQQALSDEDDEEEFEDAVESSADIYFDVPKPPGHRRTSSEESGGALSKCSNLDFLDVDGDVGEGGGGGRRKSTLSVIQRRGTSSRSSLGTNHAIASSSPEPHDQHSTTSTTVDARRASSSRNSLMSSLEVLRAAGTTTTAPPVVGAGGAASSSAAGRQRRTRVPDKPNISFSLWSIMKNCIGKDLSKIPVPVNFSEPLSMLQRLVEDFEYSEILHQAAVCTNEFEQMAFVAAFTVSAYSTTSRRTGKPFNPLLGETYECDRSDDKGFRCISEQVSHHPPMVAQYCESTIGTTHSNKRAQQIEPAWKCWQEFTMRSRFKGKYLEMEPLGIAHLLFPDSGNHYTWRKVKTVVHNIVIGKLWIDQHGEMEVINHHTGSRCHMKFEPYSYFGGVAKKVTGTIVDKDDRVCWVLNGTWDTKLEGSRVIGESSVRGKNSVLEAETPKVLWSVHPPYAGSEDFYNLSKFACELNEPEDGVAPTDTRLRPDQRMMETGEWDVANTEKVRLEEKQRAVRRQREVEAEMAAQEGRVYEPYHPTWFRKVEDEQNGGKLIFSFDGTYWDCKAKQDWLRCPDIF